MKHRHRTKTLNVKILICITALTQTKISESFASPLNVYTTVREYFMYSAAEAVKRNTMY